MKIINDLLFIILLVGVLPFLHKMIMSLWHKEFGIDIIAATGILASLLVGEYLAGIVILIMLTGGEALDQYARTRARKGLSHLLSNAPTQAHRKSGEEIEDIPAGSVNAGDVLVIKQGELIPVDGIILTGTSLVDESALTGESLPVQKHTHDHVMSGSLCTEGVLEVKALKPSSESKYEQIVKLVRDAENKKAPFVRLADRYSVWFTIIAFTLALLAWGISKNPTRALAVLVVATPCPLLLAAPIAFASGISRAAGRGIIVKNGGVLEKLSEAKTMLFDKTGTLTLGIPTVIGVLTYGSQTKDSIMKIGASLDQLSPHILAQSLVSIAHTKKMELLYPDHFEEHLGKGVRGHVGGSTYFFGSLQFLQDHHIPIADHIRTANEISKATGVMNVYLATTKEVLGSIQFADQIRESVPTEFAHLKRLIPNLIMATGDKQRVADKIAHQIGISEVRSECLPEDKLRIIHETKTVNRPVIMVGDGVNDAPALAASDVGIVLGSKSSTSAHEAGDIVIVVDTFDRIREIILIAKKVMFIAKQCIFIGIGLSILLMFAAAFGLIKPVVGAFLQEIIDVIVILNALRVHTKTHEKYI